MTASVLKGTVTSQGRALSSPVLERGCVQGSVGEGRQEWGRPTPSRTELSVRGRTQTANRSIHQLLSLQTHRCRVRNTGDWAPGRYVGQGRRYLGR